MLPFGAGNPVSGQSGAGAVEVVTLGLVLAAASSCAGDDEQAVSTSPASPVVASAPQASGRRARVR